MILLDEEDLTLLNTEGEILRYMFDVLASLELSYAANYGELSTWELEKLFGVVRILEGKLEEVE
jgi:hypothetical protein